MRWPVVSEAWTREPAPPGLDLLDAVDGRCCVLLHGEGRFGILGRNLLGTLEGLDLGGLRFERSGDLPPVLPDLMGFSTYEAGYDLEPLAGVPHPDPMGLPRHHWGVYGEVLVHDRQTGLLHRGRRDVSGLEGGGLNQLGAGAFRAWKQADTEDRASFMAKVARIREAIAGGHVYQVNLTRQEVWGFEGDLRTFARRLHAANPAPRSALVAGSGWSIVSSSPEVLLTLEGGRMVTRPIKGTAPRGETPEADRRQAEDLLASAKNQAELAMIVDLLRNDLARVCQWPSVRVEAFPELETYANVHHLVATVSGRPRVDLGLEDLFRGLFPGGSITGCPKLAAMQLIRELEPAPRSIYTGTLGWIRSDLQAMDLSLTIRTAWAREGVLRFGVGGGITWDSDPSDEYDETIHKGRSLVQCLS